jgi:hypothetical protein
MVNNFNFQGLAGEKRVDGGLDINSLFLGFVHQLFDNLQIFFLLIIGLVKLFQTTLQKLAFELDDAVS